MMNAIQANAPGLPTRRTALAILAGAGTAISLAAVAAAGSGTTEPAIEWDAGTIAHARRVQALAARTAQAIRCVIRADAKAESLKPPRPGRLAAMPAWRAECDAVEHRCGLHAAQRLAAALDGRLTAAATELALMPASTREGMAAKAQACAAVLAGYRDSMLPGWLHTLVTSTLNDALQLGGAA